jgi:DNA (cytosine-5)-methyltransferase 1
MHNFNYRWFLKDGYPAKGIEKNGLKVYSTFACGGGSTMGYKLAGFDVIGANDIDPQMAKVYQENHHPEYYDLCPIGELLSKDLPDEYYNLDILDGSPPCSTFSMAGSREKAFKKDKVFREGQAKQVLSDLFFDWIKLVDKLKPKVAIAENVKGMLSGNAKAYTRTILNTLNKIGYTVQLFCLNAASMGVPQRRERVFFICTRTDLNFPKIKLNFNEKPIFFKEIDLGKTEKRPKITQNYARKIFEKANTLNGRAKNSKNNNTLGFLFRAKLNSVLPTIMSTSAGFYPTSYHWLSDKELILAGSFPADYNFLDIKPSYLIGMSVPPVMMAQVAHQVYLQFFQ